MQHATNIADRTEQAPTLTADDLARMTVAELDQLYRSGTVPDSLHVLDGAPRGRMLAVTGLDRGPLAGGIRRFAASSRFPWAGKSFQASDDGHGEGINRVRLLGDRYRFTTYIEDSVIDGAPCIRLDYDHPDNPFFIRAIRDELRQVGPELFLGPAILDLKQPRLVLYFAIDKS